MTKIKPPRELTDEQIKEIKDILEAIELATNEQIDQSLSLYGREIIYAYRFWIINTNQKKKLSDYRSRKDSKKNEEIEKTLFEKLMIMEQEFEETPRIHQMWVIQDRIVVASTRTVTIGKEDREVANGWDKFILEIFKHRTPKLYEHCKKKYQIYVKE